MIGRFYSKTLTIIAIVVNLSCTPPDGSESLVSQENVRARYVETQPAQVRSFTREIPFIGLASPTEMVSLHFALSGRLQSCPVRDGDVVKLGDVICQLDTGIIDLEIERARSALESAQKVLASNFMEKQRRLFRDGVIGQVEYEKARIEYEAAMAQQSDARSLLELAQKKKAEHLLRAPWGGRVTGLTMSTGQLLTPEVRIGILTASPSKNIHRIETKVHASKFGTINIGDLAELNSVAGRSIHPTARGSVVKLSQAIEPESQTFKVHVDVEMPEVSTVSLTEGMLVRGFIQSIVAEAGIVIPASSLIQWSTSNDALVYVVGQEHRLEERKISVADYAHDDVLISSGISPGDIVVTRFAADLFQGMLVETGEATKSTLSPPPSKHDNEENEDRNQAGETQ